jgi:predicted metal-dependent phosphoesterase TrpH
LRLKIDLHVHTIYSVDSLIRPEEVAYYASKRGLDGVAVTDHDRLDGALRMSKGKDFLILPGMEITSLDGHILALNVQDPVQKGMTAEETVNKIHDADGIAVACHPAAMFKGSLGDHTTSMFDAVEVMNSSAIPFEYSVKRGEQIASRLKIARVAGSDAHYGPEIGCAYTLFEAEPNAEDIVKAIKRNRCQPFGKAIPLAVRFKREISVLSRRFAFGGEK